MAFDYASVIADVRRGAMFPDSDADGSAAADIIAKADIELRTRIYPLCMKYAEEFFVRRMTISVAAGQAGVRMPTRAALGKWSDVWWIASDGTKYNLVRFDPEETWRYQTNQGQPYGFYLENNNIGLLPIPSSAGSLLIKYVPRASTLVSAAFATITAASETSTTMTFTVGSAPSTSATYDIIAGTEPYEVIAHDVAGGGSTTWVVQKTALDGLTPVASYVGGKVQLAGQSTQVVLPVEYYDLLVQRTICRLLRTVGDERNLKLAEEDAAFTENAITTAFSTRVDGAPKIASGGLRTGLRIGGYWRGF